jgi:hypothetical protein
VDPFSRKYLAISYRRRLAYLDKWLGNVISDSTIDSNVINLAENYKKFNQPVPANTVGH